MSSSPEDSHLILQSPDQIHPYVSTTKLTELDKGWHPASSPDFDGEPVASSPDFDGGPLATSPDFDGEPLASSPDFDGEPLATSPVFDGEPLATSPDFDGGPLATSPVFDGEPLATSLVFDGEPLASSPVFDGEPLATSLVFDGEPLATSLVFDGEPLATSPVFDGEPLATSLVFDGEPLASSPDFDGEPLATSPDFDGGGPLNRSMPRTPPPRNLCLGWMGKCGDYKNRQTTLIHIIKLTQNTNDFNEKIYLTENYNQIFNTILNNLKIDLDKSNQFAFIIFIKKDDTLDTEYPKVYKPGLKNKKHSEDYIFDLLKEILDKNDCPYKEALIFSFNSPCLARPTFTSCTDQAIDIARKLHEKHGMKMVIGFYKPWGINGSYEKYLKDCSYTFVSQTLGSNDRTENKREADKELLQLLEPIYEKVLADIQNKAFLMDNIINTPKYNLEQFGAKINKITKNPQNKEKLDQIVSHLFEQPTLNKTFYDFKKHGLENFDKCMNKIYHLLIGNYFNNFIDDLVNSFLFGDNANVSDCLIDDFYLYEEIGSYLQNIFFQWWAKKVEDAFSRFLNKETSCFLQESAVYFSHRHNKEIKHYFVIGYVKKKIEY